MDSWHFVVDYERNESRERSNKYKYFRSFIFIIIFNFSGFLPLLGKCHENISHVSRFLGKQGSFIQQQLKAVDVERPLRAAISFRSLVATDFRGIFASTQAQHKINYEHFSLPPSETFRSKLILSHSERFALQEHFTSRVARCRELLPKNPRMLSANVAKATPFVRPPKSEAN